ncbi:hypothetical protein DFH28DRAFT_1110034 [Melampsora americana]|nr:hypothetical protein DFH28DRAFT_1110034 [Melampsora americana]
MATLKVMVFFLMMATAFITAHPIHEMYAESDPNDPSITDPYTLSAANQNLVLKFLDQSGFLINVYSTPVSAVQPDLFQSQESQSTPIINSTMTSKSQLVPLTKKSKQISWAKDLNKKGQSSLEGIVQWMGLTWGDQDSPEDSTWMCMDPSDLISTNYSAYHSGNTSKKECCEQLTTYLIAKDFTSCSWKGCKQQIEVFESKLRGAEAWRRQTGAGILEQAETKISNSQADPNNTFDEDKGDLIRLTAATSTKMLKQLCKFYDKLVPIMGHRAANKPLAVAEVFSSSQVNQTTTNITSDSPNENLPLPNTLDSPHSIAFEEVLELTPQSKLIKEHKKDKCQVQGPKDQMATSTQEFITFLGTQLDGPTENKANKQNLGEDPETAAKKQALDDELTNKQTKLKILKVNQELQVQQAALLKHLKRALLGLTNSLWHVKRFNGLPN